MDSGLRGRVCFLSHPSNSACQINKKILKKKKKNIGMIPSKTETKIHSKMGDDIHHK